MDTSSGKPSLVPQAQLKATDYLRGRKQCWTFLNIEGLTHGKDLISVYGGYEVTSSHLASFLIHKVNSLSVASLLFFHRKKLILIMMKMNIC